MSTWTAELQARLTALWSEGRELREIAERLGVPWGVVRYRQRAAGLWRSSYDGRTAATVARIAKAYQRGDERRAILKRYGLTLGQLMGLVHRHGWVRPGKPLRDGGPASSARGVSHRVQDGGAKAATKARAAAVRWKTERGGAGAAGQPAPEVRVTPRLPQPASESPAISSRGCQWTESTRRPWVFCGARTLEGRSWCAEHAKRVYVRRCDVPKVSGGW